MNVETILWVVFHVVVAGMLAVDLGVFQRSPHKLSLREAVAWSVVWIVVALLFNAGVWVLEGPQRGMEWLTAYLVEKALSVDNLFVFLVIFAYFVVSDHLQPRVLLRGVLGAVAMRATLIVAGVTLVELFHWVLYFFGALLVYTGWKLLRHKEEIVAPSQDPVLQAVRRRLPVTETSLSGKLFVHGARGAVGPTPLPGRGGGEYRPDVRTPLHARHPGHHLQPLHRLHLQHPRHAEFAGPVLRPGGDHGHVPLAQLRPPLGLGVPWLKMLMVNCFNIPLALSLGVAVILGASALASVLSRTAACQPRSAG